MCVTYAGDISCGLSPKKESMLEKNPRFDTIILLLGERVSVTPVIVTLSQSQPFGSEASKRDPPPLAFHSAQPL